MYDRVVFSELSDNNLRAELFGREVDSFSEDIKAVTYHGASVSKNSDGNLEIIILFDI